MMGTLQDEQMKQWAIEMLPESVKREVGLFLLGYNMQVERITDSQSLLIAYAEIVNFLDAQIPSESQDFQNWLIKPGYDGLLVGILNPSD